MSDSAETSSVARWRAERRWLNEHRHDLGQIAARRYTGVPRVGGTSLLTAPGWQPDAPVSLDQITLNWTDHAPAVGPAGEASAGVRPRQPDGQPYPSYAQAMAGVERPRLLENRPCYRLLDAALDGPSPALRLAPGWYFDGVDAGEGAAHELAAAVRSGLNPDLPGRLRLRERLGAPADLAGRCSLVALTVVTLRVPPGGEPPTFVLHWRDPAAVVHAGGLYQVMPVGVFQPAGDGPAARQRDFDLWRFAAREFSEEFLGTPEDYGTDLDYDRWPFCTGLAAARRAGKAAAWCSGLGVDPLTFAADLLCAAAFTSDVFDTLFAGLLDGNDEGRVVRWPGQPGVPFTADLVARFSGGAEPMQPAGAAALQLAWRHRDRLRLG